MMNNGAKHTERDGAARTWVAGSDSAIFRGLLWREWLLHGRLIKGFLAAWLIGLWALLIFFHPGWLLGFGLLFALLAGAAMGGADAAEGSEEFAFALPVSRHDHFLARLVPGLLGIALFCGIGCLAIAWDLPQMVWGLFVNSGFTEPFPVVESRCVYGLAMTVPLAAFSFTFAIAALAQSRGMVGFSWFFGALCAAAIMGLCFLAESWLWRNVESGEWSRVNGYISCPILLAASAMALLTGYLAYQRKEGISRPGGAGGRPAWWIFVVIGIGLVFLFLGFSVLKYERASALDTRASGRRTMPEDRGRPQEIHTERPSIQLKTEMEVE